MVNETIGHFQITGKLGRGGMGEVYRARDTKLDREVAIKILPSTFANDRSRVARFNREAKVLASLNHTNIASIYGIEQTDDVFALVMELVEGETLGQRLSRAPMTVAESLECCRQIAEALEAAHEQGIVHRDLKPENIQIDPCGRVKVLDFGLAKDLADVASAPEQANAPTITDVVTMPGVILGTAPYMSPEQASARPVDKRADIWSFGCLLYECVVGKPAFGGEDVAETLASILKAEPSWGRLPKDTPPPICLLLRKCLNKDPRQRLRDIGDARIDIVHALDETKSPEAGPTYRGSEERSLGARPWVRAGCAAGIFSAGALLVMLIQRASPNVENPKPVRTMIQPLSRIADEALFHVALAVSPNGEHIAYVDQGLGRERMLYVHNLNTGKVRPLEETEGAINPFFSYDGQSLGYADITRGVLRTVSIYGGSPISIAESPSLDGAVWLEDNTIIYAPGGDAGGQGEGIWRVSALGGDAKPLIGLESEEGEVRQRWPSAGPGDSILFTSYRNVDGLEHPRLEAYSLDGGSRRVVLVQCGFARYVPTGHLVYTRNGSLFSSRLDRMKQRVVGTPVPLDERVRQHGVHNSTQMDFSNTGTLVFIPSASKERELVWVNDRGISQPVGAPLRAYEDVSLATNRQMIAAAIDSQVEDSNLATADIWVYDIPRDNLKQVTFNGRSVKPRWLPDSRQLMYLRHGIGTESLDLQRLDADGSDELIAQVPKHFLLGYSLRSDLSSVLGVLYLPAQNQDIIELDLRSNDAVQRTLADEPSWQRGPRLSPDENWFAYCSHEEGRWEVYVRPYPGPGARIKISDGGGFEPTWDPLESKLYYRNSDEIWMVPYSVTDTFEPDAPTFLFNFHAFGGLEVHSYEATGDGRFLMIREDMDPSRQIRVTSNWFSELSRLLPSDEE